MSQVEAFLGIHAMLSEIYTIVTPLPLCDALRAGLILCFVLFAIFGSFAPLEQSTTELRLDDQAALIVKVASDENRPTCLP